MLPFVTVTLPDNIKTYSYVLTVFYFYVIIYLIEVIKMAKKRGMNGYYALRWYVLQRDNFTCQYCGQFAPNVALEIDHITSVEDGGQDEPDNLKTSCYACNRGKQQLKVRLKYKQSLSLKPLNTIKLKSQKGVYQIMLSSPDKVFSPRELAQLSFTSLPGTRAQLSNLAQQNKIKRVGLAQWTINHATVGNEQLLQNNLPSPGRPPIFPH